MTHSQTLTQPTRIQPFRQAFCERFSKSKDVFEERLFWDAIPPTVRPIGRVVRYLSPDFFQVDFDFIRKLAAAESQREVARMVNNVRFDPRFSRGFLRSVLRVRISGGR